MIVCAQGAVTALDIQVSLRNPMAILEDSMTSVKMLLGVSLSTNWSGVDFSCIDYNWLVYMLHFSLQMFEVSEVEKYVTEIEKEKEEEAEKKKQKKAGTAS